MAGLTGAVVHGECLVLADGVTRATPDAGFGMQLMRQLLPL